MVKIKANDLIAIFRQMKDEHWQYVAGAAEKGKVDCSGAFVWAYRQFGRSIYHGSNRMARTEVESLIPVKGAQIVPGMAAFKRREPGEANYALPDEYRTGGQRCNGDLCDYYHVGLVAADGKTVLNAQSSQTGFVASPISERWSHVGYLKQVEYGAEADSDAPGETDGTDNASGDAGSSGSPSVPERLTVATVYAENGKPVKMRNRPMADDEKTTWDWVPVGATVTVRAIGMDGWTPIRYNGREGYMMDKFLRYGSAPDRECAEPDSITPPGATGDPRGWLVSNLTEAEARETVARYPEGRVQQAHG